MMTGRKTVLVDLDETLVSMLPVWLKKYGNITGDIISPKDVVDYDLKKFCKNGELLYSILEKPGFFYDLPPIPGALKYFQKLIDDRRFEVMVVTQPPRTAHYAIRDKREWMKTFFPNFDLTNMIFCHKKEYIRGDVLFDDAPHHLCEWNKVNKKGVTVKINYPYNAFFPSSWAFNRNTAWMNFYDNLIKMVEWKK